MPRPHLPHACRCSLELILHASEQCKLVPLCCLHLLPCFRPGTHSSCYLATPTHPSRKAAPCLMVRLCPYSQVYNAAPPFCPFSLCLPMSHMWAPPAAKPPLLWASTPSLDCWPRGRPALEAGASYALGQSLIHRQCMKTRTLCPLACALNPTSTCLCHRKGGGI
jgi:hypothetical protein